MQMAAQRTTLQAKNKNNVRACANEVSAEAATVCFAAGLLLDLPTMSALFVFRVPANMYTCTGKYKTMVGSGLRGTSLAVFHSAKICNLR